MSSPVEEIRMMLLAMKGAPMPDDVGEKRALMVNMMELAPPLPGSIFEKITVEGIPAEWASHPEAARDRVILYLHGGGYIMGSCNTHREMVSRITVASGARALMIDYRLAPENPFPAAVEDASRAYRWLL